MNIICYLCQQVNSRPSVCLTNFLLNGRQVMLEQPRKVGSKVISHMLASHGGEIFLHCLATARSSLEDPPSISEGCGGRVTDYRITDFGEFMKENRLAPCQPTPETEEEPPIERGKFLKPCMKFCAFRGGGGACVLFAVLWLCLFRNYFHVVQSGETKPS